MRCFCVCPFKCKWAGAPGPLFRRGRSFKSSCSAILATTNTQQTNLMHWKCQKLSSGLTRQCFNMQFLTTTFLFPIILVACEGSISETGRGNGSFSSIRLTECQEALSERQFGKQNMTCFVWSWRSRTKCFDPSFRINFCENPALKWLGFGPEYSIIRIFVRWVDIQISILRFEYSFFFFLFFLHLAPPAKRFSFAFEYESPMRERHDSVHLEVKTKMPKTSAVWEHFKLSEDKTKAVCQICDLKLA